MPSRKAATLNKKIPIKNGQSPRLRAKRRGSGLPDQTTRSPGSSHGNSVVMRGRFAPVLGALLLDVAQILVEHDAVLARERDETLAARPTDQRQAGLAGKLDPPGREA